MGGTLRSKQGCWTCRLRRKKCDEGRPYCSICQSLSITCYGYGKKPDFFGSGDEERAVANSIKEIVKFTSRRKGASLSSGQGIPVARIAPKPLKDAGEELDISNVTDLQQTAEPALKEKSQPETSPDPSQDVSTVSKT